MRKISRECVVTLDKVRSNKGSIEALIDNVEEAFLNINTDRVGDNIRKASEQVDSAVSKINEIIANKGAIRGVPMGFKDLDSKTHGLHANEMIVIAGRPGTGKTSIALNIVESAIFSNPPYPTLVFSLEMLADDLYMRMIASRARADQHKLAEGRIDNNTKADILTTAKSLTNGVMPMGVCAMKQEIMDSFREKPGNEFVSGNTFGAHNLACAAAIATLDYI